MKFKKSVKQNVNDFKHLHFNFVYYNNQQFLFVCFLIISTFYKQLKSVHAFSRYLLFTGQRICFSISFYERCTNLLTN